MHAKIGSPQARSRRVELDMADTDSRFRRVTSKGQITIPQIMRKRYNITMQTKLEFVPSSEGILLRPAKEEGSFKELAGSASKTWTVDEMLKRLNELRKENA